MYVLDHSSSSGGSWDFDVHLSFGEGKPLPCPSDKYFPLPNRPWCDLFLQTAPIANAILLARLKKHTVSITTALMSRFFQRNSPATGHVLQGRLRKPNPRRTGFSMHHPSASHPAFHPAFHLFRPAPRLDDLLAEVSTTSALPGPTARRRALQDGGRAGGAGPTPSPR